MLNSFISGDPNDSLATRIEFVPDHSRPGMGSGVAMPVVAPRQTHLSQHSGPRLSQHMTTLGKNESSVEMLKSSLTVQDS